MHLNNLTFWQYLLLCTVAFFMAGVFWYNVDKKWGVIFVRGLNKHVLPLLYKFRNLFRKTPLPIPGPSAKECGLIYNRPARTRWSWAIAISSVESATLVFTGTQNPFVEMIAWVWEIPVFMLGLMAGPLVWKLFWSKKDTFFEKIDKLESGELKIGQEIRERVHGVKEGIEHAIESAGEKVGNLIHGEKPKTEVEKPAAAPPPEMTGEEAREVLAKFTGKAPKEEPKPMTSPEISLEDGMKFKDMFKERR